MKTAHIISHTHWDREWYLPYEKHHMLQIELMDSLLDTIKRDKDFKSFHLDGQTIMLEDYLQVRPEREDELKEAIKEGKIQIGPWYILQDEWLTSSESNVRNLQIGLKDCKKYKSRCLAGYFPDSFGNMGQAPQLLKEAGIDTAVFGRGVKPTGFNNETSDGNGFESKYSEMYWESPDGSKVLGILFANWYSNGIEVPVEEKVAKEYWEKKLKDAMKYASTDELLFMNGCDHQPVQTDLAAAIQTASRLYPDISFVHSDFPTYINAVKEQLKEDLAVIKGELRSQHTNGWYTLANTASARIYLKQMNQRCEMLFTKVAEPLCAMAYALGMEYPHHLFTYGWKTLMQNHPHDSICGCSVDEVHREMVARFEKAEQVALHIIGEAMGFFSQRVDTSCFDSYGMDKVPFFVANPTGYTKKGVVEAIIPAKKFYFSDCGVWESIRLSKEVELPDYKIIDQSGKILNGKVTVLSHSFDYDLPKDKFRQPFMLRNVKVELEVEEIKEFSIATFALVNVADISDYVGNQTSMLQSDGTIENEFIKVKVEENGSLTLTDKNSNKVYKDFGILEDCGDVGNEYIYGTLKNDEVITTKDAKPVITIEQEECYQTIVRVEYCMEIPKSADELLAEEIADLKEFNRRNAGRSKDKIQMPVTVWYTIERLSKSVKVKVEFDNQAFDHRIRVLFPTRIDTSVHYADSIFEVAKRNNVPEAEWENPCNAAHQQAFVNLHDEEGGVTIANKGLNEYEILRDGENTIALTIHRGVREMGDWGIFMTPEAQCLGKKTVEYAIIVHDKEELYDSYQRAYDFQRELPIKEIMADTKSFIQADYQLLHTNNDNQIMWSSLKVSEETKDIVGRWYNVSQDKGQIAIKAPFSLYYTNVLEEKNQGKAENTIDVNPYKILSIGMRK